MKKDVTFAVAVAFLSQVFFSAVVLPFPAYNENLNLSVSPACITLTEKFTSQLLFITYASLFDNLKHNGTTLTCSECHLTPVTQ